MNKTLTQTQSSARFASGFTLVELMITVAIVGILTAVAVPAYKDYARRGQLPDAFASLADYRIKLEQYYQDNRRYGTSSCADGANAPAWNNFAPASAKYFSFACTLNVAGGQGFLLTATGISGQAVGHVYTLDFNNVRGTTQFKGASSSKACWLLKGDEC